ncbi:MAG: hypothetical protein ABSC19_07405 [Syntrophorhabdales bacterium]|jgi:hypothetical protein
MPENKAQIVLEGKAESLTNALKQGERQIKTFGDRSIATFNRVGQSIRTFSDKYINMLTTVGVGIGMTEMTKDVLEFEGALRKIRRTGNLTAAQIGSLRTEILGLIDPASKVKIALTKGEWVDIAGALRAANVELETTKAILPQIGKGAVASGLADKRLYAEALGEFIDKYKIRVKELPALQDQLNAAMKMPGARKDPEAFLQGFLSLAKPMQIMGATGMRNVTPLIAAYAELAHISASPGEAAGGIEALLNGFFRLQRNPKMMRELAANGVQFFDKDRNLKTINELLPQFKKLEEAGKRHGVGVEQAAMTVFGRPEGAKAVMSIINNYDEIVAKERQLGAASGDMERDFTLEMRSMSASLKTFQNQLDSFKVSGMAVALKYLSGVLDQLIAHPFISKVILGTGLTIGGAIIIDKMVNAFKGLYGYLKEIRDIWSGGKKGGLEGAMTKMGGGIPVYVTNWGGGPSGRGGESPGQRTAESAAGGALGKYGSKALPYAGMLLRGGVYTAAAIEAYKELRDGLHGLAFRISDEEREKLITKYTGLSADQFPMRGANPGPLGGQGLYRTPAPEVNVNIYAENGIKLQRSDRYEHEDQPQAGEFLNEKGTAGQQ